ncbi:MAG: hypothetical protein IT453_15075 [Planctomycetes bacterium]|nr:hypothetical protein [Planctomycetota bacterium]
MRRGSFGGGVGRIGSSRTLLVVLVACVGLLGGAAWWLFVVQPVAPSERAPEIASTPSEPAASVAPEPAASTTAKSELAVPSNETHAPTRIAAGRERPGAPATTPVPKGPALVVVDAATRKPIADAEVALLSLDKVAARELVEGSRLAAETERRGKRARTDSHGRVELAAKRNSMHAVAWTKDRWGCGPVAPKGNTELALHLDGPLEVRVHDSAGRPVAGAPIALAYYFPSSASYQRWVETLTDERGRAVLEHGRAWLEYIRPAPLTVFVDGAFVELVKREVTLDDVGTLVPLEVPTFGSVAVRVLDFEGREVTAGATVSLAAPGPSLPPAPGKARELVDGVAVFPAVAVGVAAKFQTTLRVGKQQVGPITASTTVEKAGERVELVLGGPNSVPVLVVRVLDDELKPLANQALDVNLVPPVPDGAGKPPTPVTTDANGLVRLHLPGWPNGGGAVRLVAAPTRWRKILTAVVDVPVALALGEQTLGDVVLRGLPLLVAGRVVDQLGQPIPNANVNVLRRAKDGVGWSDVGSADLTDPMGEFAMDADPESGEFAVRASATDCARAEPVPFTRGSSGLELSLVRFASLDGTVRIDPELSPQEINVTWIVDDPAGKARQHTLVGRPMKSTDGIARASFSQRSLPTGIGKLEIRAISTVVHTLEPLELRPGPNPTILEDLDLRQLVRIFNLTIRDQQGQDIRAGQIHFRPSGSSEPWQLWQFQKGRARILALAPELDLSIFGAPGRMTLFERVRGENELVLDGPIWVKLAVDGNPLRAPDTLTLVVELAEASDPSLVPTLRNPIKVAPDDTGRALVALAAAGKYSVAFQIGCTERGSSAQVGPKVEFEVQARDGEQDVAIEAPRAAIEQLHSRLLEAPSEKR